ncbi:hypothetical protein DIPPA_29750 [Diplonema papillatum]|nr:hypothetical protein DIPPA_29750 [Diplonema papillatum]
MSGGRVLDDGSGDTLRVGSSPGYHVRAARSRGRSDAAPTLQHSPLFMTLPRGGQQQRLGDWDKFVL